MRRVVSLGLGLGFLLPLWGCGDPKLPSNNFPAQQQSPPALVRSAEQTQNLQDGQYPVQQASFDDSSGQYTVMLLNTPAGMSSTLKANDLPMARLTDEQIKAGEKSHVKVEGGKPSLYLTEDFKIAYEHTATEVRQNPQTGQRETVVVQRESSFWSPFLGSVAGNIAGQAIGNMLFRPQYYVPPAYRPGMGGLSGYGGYGDSYGRAVDNYRTRYNEPPVVERNRTTFRSTGAIRDISGSTRQLPSGQGGAFKPQPPSPKVAEPSIADLDKSKSTGSGYGSSNLRKTGKSYNSPTIENNRRNSGGFGSSSRSRGSFGSGRSGGGRRR